MNTRLICLHVSFGDTKQPPTHISIFGFLYSSVVF